MCLYVESDSLFDLDALRKLQSDNQRKILIEFYHSTNGPEWKNNTNWCSDEPLSAWYGVQCNWWAGTLTGLDLRNNGLKGKLMYTTTV